MRTERDVLSTPDLGDVPPPVPSLVWPRRGLLALASTAAMLLHARRATAAEAGAVSVKRASPPRVALPDHFSGQVQVTAPFKADAPARASGAIVSFAPGARTDWHTHPLGQTLVVLSGTGLVQRWGDQAQHIGPGDVAWIPPGAKHWHGAGPDQPMSHLAVSEALDGRTADWLESVSDAQYAQASASASRP